MYTNNLDNTYPTFLNTKTLYRTTRHYPLKERSSDIRIKPTYWNVYDLKELVVTNETIKGVALAEIFNDTIADPYSDKLCFVGTGKIKTTIFTITRCPLMEDSNWEIVIGHFKNLQKFAGICATPVSVSADGWDCGIMTEVLHKEHPLLCGLIKQQEDLQEFVKYF